jgi:hypothetical protein
MLRATIVTCIIAGALGAQTPTAKAPAWIQGRWTTATLPAAFNFSGDSLEVMVIPLQGPSLHYRVNGKTIEVTADGKAGPPANMVLRKDTLILSQGGQDVRFLRLGVEPWDSTSLQGSWRMNVRDRSTVLSFRSDGIMISENGRTSDPNFRSDTLEISFTAAQSRRYVFRRAGDTLYMRPVMGGNEQAYLRRPWGCFSNPAVNGTAKECR